MCNESDRVLKHDFLAELSDGTLLRDAFPRFVVQEALLLAYVHAIGGFAHSPSMWPTPTAHTGGVVAAKLKLHPQLLVVKDVPSRLRVCC